MTAGLLVELGEPGRIDRATSGRVHGLVTRLALEQRGGIIDAVPGYTSVLIEYDPKRISAGTVRTLVAAAAGADRPPGRSVTIPVVYDGPDLADAADRLGLSAEQLVRMHTGQEFDVYTTSFSPGMPLAGELPPKLRLPRRATPRREVAPGSVAIAGAQTGVYTLPTPGGWHLLGRALVNPFEPARPVPALVSPLDRIRFRAAQGAAPRLPGPLELLPAEPVRPVLRVARAGLADLVVDAGRNWTAVLGLSRSGPLDANAARIAAALVGNRPGTPLLELNLSGPVLEALADTVFAVCGPALVPVVDGESLPAWTSHPLRRGQRLEFRPTGVGARSYLALAGGIESGLFMGSASVDTKAKVGRPLKQGDVLGAGHALVRPGRSFTPYRARGFRLRLLRGPQWTAEAAAALTSQPFTLTSASRMGLRLAGSEAVPGGDVLSEPVAPGSIQVAADGNPMILLADRGPVGGYAKPARLHPAELDRAGQLRVGDTVRFGF